MNALGRVGHDVADDAQFRRRLAEGQGAGARPNGPTRGGIETGECIMIVSFEVLAVAFRILGNVAWRILAQQDRLLFGAYDVIRGNGATRADGGHVLQFGKS